MNSVHACVENGVLRVCVKKAGAQEKGQRRQIQIQGASPEKKAIKQ